MGEKPALESYREKRNFGATPEPRGAPRSAAHQNPRFVVQLHDARTLHYDFRLEVGGVLKSWAVPKGPSTDPREKRLATPTEDHPLDYEDFEGVIPEGEYGAGTVLIWDAGTYRNLTEHDGKEVPVEEGLEHGHIKVWLEGQKLTGGYALSRLRDRDGWLLVKVKDEAADARRNPVRTQPESVRTGRSLDDISAEES